MKSMQDAITVGGNLYKSCLSLNKFTTNIEKKSQEYKDQLKIMSKSVDPLSNSLSQHENQVIYLLEKIQSLSYDWERIIGKVGELRSHIVPKLDVMLNSLQDAQSALKTSDPDDLKTIEV